MAPKKKHQQKKSTARASSSSSNPKSQSSDAKLAPKVQISAENERRLRRLLLNTERPSPSPATPPDAAASLPQRAKLIRGVYDKLSLEGFTSDQIERALAALKEGTTFEDALDWLCLNLHGNELPVKFSRGATCSALPASEGTITVLSTAQDDWVPLNRQLVNTEELGGFSIRRKGHLTESIDFGKSSHTDWIRQYMERQEMEELEEQQKEEVEPQDANTVFCETTIIEDYRLARLGALEAKERGDHKSQQHFSEIIRKMRQQMAELGISDDFSLSSSQAEPTCLPHTSLSFSRSDLGVCPAFVPVKPKPGVDVNPKDLVSEEKIEQYCENSVVHESSMDMEVKQEQQELELDDLFHEDSLPSQSSSLEILKPQKKGKSSKISYGHVLFDISEIWRKDDSKMYPKAVLQKLSQRLGWEAPKYNKLSEKERKVAYNVSILRSASGRGKGRKIGGLITIQLPDKYPPFESVEDAQNTVAAFALCHLFPGVPIDLLLVEPYASFITSWEDELTDVEKEEETRRSDFVDSLLKTQTAQLLMTNDNSNMNPECLEDIRGNDAGSSFPTKKTDRFDSRMEAESKFLKREQDEKKKLPKYLKTLEVRAALPMFHLKDKLLELLRMNNVVVVCGETGSGKTTQVPQFILDDMIQSNMGGYCSIICTQPRRIAAISVAERVSEERCEPPPGCDGSIVGYQVRLESSRNQRTRLLFCTTGILLRRLVGDKDLSGITHLIVDEVHERSLLGDFLLIILKGLIERRSTSGSNLKVILMSATVDSSLFSKYFDNCPILTAEGRLHPVETIFLEDVYEKLSYCLPLDSPASGQNSVSTRGKQLNHAMDQNRGKRSTVLSGWGDETLLDQDYKNPHYVASEYELYSERTRQNLRNLNEDAIDFELLEDLIFFIDDNHPDGAVLVFLPGIAEINMLVDRLLGTYRFSGESSDWILPLHSSLSSMDQRKVFLTPPQGIRKVIIATDIAETSITIDDVVYVIDVGKHKEKRYNPQRKMSSMIEDWISRANAKQRCGRAGRVKAGICFCLYTRYRFVSLMRSFQVPEILRLPLTELCLQIKALSLGNVHCFLSKAIEPPSQDAISSAISLLYEVGAIEGDEELSPLGHHLAKLPVDILIGKMMIYGAIFGCLSPILTIAASLSYKLPFLYARDEKMNIERAKQLLLGEKNDIQSDIHCGKKQSDHILLAIAYDKWSRALHEGGSQSAQHFCRSFFLSNPTMYMIREMRVQFGHLLADIGLVDLPSKSERGGKMRDKLDSWFADLSHHFNKYSLHSPIVKSILCAGLYPNVAASGEGIYGTALVSNRVYNSGHGAAWYDGKREVHIHPSSVNFNVKHFQYPFMVFLEKVETSKIFLRDTTIVSPYSILLFGGLINVQHQMGTVIIDNWLKLTAPAPIAVLFKELRFMIQVVLKELIRKPETSLVAKNEVLRSIIQLLLEEDESHAQ